MTRRHLVLGAGLVLAIVIVVIGISRSHDDVAQTGDMSGRRITEADSGNHRTGPRSAGAPSASPALPREGAQPAGAAGEGSATATDYQVGDVHVRDHRAGDHPKVDVPPAFHPREGRKIPAQLTYAISQGVQRVVNACAASIPDAAKLGAPHVDGEIKIAIKASQATVTSATYQLRDLGGSLDAVKACMEQKSVGVATSSGDEPDVENYAITLSFRLP
jgi:hypothetical protein